jgi:tRNA (cmo5U34)-methyltransferase
MSTVRKHFEKRAGDFDGRIVRIVPGYREMMDALVGALPFGATRPIRVLDIGCGTGTLALCIKQNFPRARITCQDLAQNMIVIAKKKLKIHRDMLYRHGDILTYRFDGPFDAVVSSLALHHIEAEKEKRDLYKKIYEALSRNGVFYNADIVRWSSPYLRKRAITTWKRFMRTRVSRKEAEAAVKRYRNETKRFTLADEMRWLADAGFRDTDIIWKKYSGVVYGGVK